MLPLKRTNSASSLQKVAVGKKKGNLSARSTKSQESDVSDLLSIAGVSNVKSKPALSKSKPAIIPHKTIQKSLKSHLVESFNSRDGKLSKKPAWALKPPIDDETPRSEISNSTWSRPSLDDFLDLHAHKDPVSVNSINVSNSVKKSENQICASNKSSSTHNALNNSKKREIFLKDKVFDSEQCDAAEISSAKTAKNGDSPRDFFVETKLQLESIRSELSVEDDIDFKVVKTFSDRDDNFPSWNTKLFTKKPKQETLQLGPSESNSVESIINKKASSRINKANKSSNKKVLNEVPKLSSKVKNNLLIKDSSLSNSLKKNQLLYDEILFSSDEDSNKNSGNKDEVLVDDISEINSLSVNKTANNIKQSYMNMCGEVIKSSYAALSVESQDQAARCIQSWWKKICLNREIGAIKIQNMLESKKEQVEKMMSLEKQDKSKKAVDYDQLKRREEKARLARQKVIDEMHAKRVTKTTGKKPSTSLYENSSVSVSSKAKSTHSKFDELRPEAASLHESSLGKSSIVRADQSSPVARPDTSSSVARLTEDIFKSSDRSAKSKSQQSSTNQSEDNKLREHSVNSSKTFLELMNTLKELEDEPIIKEPVKTWDADENLTFRKTPPGTLLSADKLQSIMNFLDNVVKVEDEVRSEILSVSKSHLHSTPQLGSDFYDAKQFDLPMKVKEMDTASLVASEISDAISAQKHEIIEKQKTVEMMKKAINQQKEFSSVQILELEKEHKQQLALQCNEYEATIQRHLSFIDQLIDDKKVLTQRCEELVNKLKEMDQKFSIKIKQMTESHAMELKKQKEVSEAAEKIRRDKWIKEKTQEIKELTVKGLEPEIQRLITKHKAEIKAIKSANQAEVVDVDERVGRKYLQQLEDLKGQYEKDKEAAVRKERESSRQRFEQQIQEEEDSFQQQRRRLYSEIEEEKQRISELLQTAKKEFDERRNAYENTSRQMLTSLQEDSNKQLREMQDNCQSEMRHYKEQIEIEKQQWIENYIKKQETQLLAKERDLKEKVKVARDQEIEMVIDKLERETAQSRDDAEKAAENRIKRIRDKYMSEIKEYEQSERALQDKCNGLKEHIEKLESDIIQIRSSLKHKDQEIVEVKKITDRLQEERGKVNDIIRQEYADRIVATEEESNRLRKELSEEKARHRFDVEKITKEKENEMDELHNRVKKAISKKEETTNLLLQQKMAAEKRAEHLEHLLTEQRKKILGK